MKKIILLLILSAMPILGWCFNIHMHLEPTGYKEIKVTYVLCGTNPALPDQCDEGAKFSDTLKANDSVGIGYQGHVVVTSVTWNGYPIWGPYPADLSKNICSSIRNDSVTFIPNGGISVGITCIPSMG